MSCICSFFRRFEKGHYNFAYSHGSILKMHQSTFCTKFRSYHHVLLGSQSPTYAGRKKKPTAIITYTTVTVTPSNQLMIPSRDM